MINLSTKLYIAIIILLVILCVVTPIITAISNNKIEKYQQLEVQLRVLHAKDSIRDRMFKELMDSLGMQQNLLKKEITQRQLQDTKLLNNIHDLRKKFNDIIVPVRPEF